MKKTSGVLLFFIGFCSHNSRSMEIIPYESSHKEAVWGVIDRGNTNLPESLKVLLTQEQIRQAKERSRADMNMALESTCNTKKVLIDAQRRITGFMIVDVDIEKSCEWLRTMYPHLSSMTNEQIQALMPWLKRTDAECEPYGVIENLIVDPTHRRQGYGRALLRNAIASMRKRWQDVKKVVVYVEKKNTAAIKLVESEAFVPSQHQPMSQIDAIQYEMKLESAQ